MSDQKPPPMPEIAWSALHSQVIQEYKDQLLIAFLRRLGGKLDIPVKEVDDTGGFLLAFSIDVPKAPTGELKLDARIHGTFHFELRRKQ